MKNQKYLLIITLLIILTECVKKASFVTYSPIKFQFILSVPLNKENFRDDISKFILPIKSLKNKSQAFCETDNIIHFIRFDIIKNIDKNINLPLAKSDKKYLLGPQTFDSKIEDITANLDKVVLPAKLVNPGNIIDRSLILSSLIAYTQTSGTKTYIFKKNSVLRQYQNIKIYNKLSELLKKIENDASNGIVNFDIIYEPNLITKEIASKIAFDNNINNGNKEFNAKNFLKAKYYYLEALSFQPKDKYALNQIKRCDAELKKLSKNGNNKIEQKKKGDGNRKIAGNKKTIEPEQEVVDNDSCEQIELKISNDRKSLIWNGVRGFTVDVKIMDNDNGLVVFYETDLTNSSLAFPINNKVKVSRLYNIKIISKYSNGKICNEVSKTFSVINNGSMINPKCKF